MITDTVGFIRELPAPLMEAFSATLEETLETDLLLLLVDLANPDWRSQLDTVNYLLDSLGANSNRQVLANKIDLIIYKKGEKGSIAITKNKEISKGIFKVKALKPTGAGDAFMGSFVGALLKNYDLEKSLEIGSAAAAIVVTKVGCAPAMPDLEEVIEFMKTNKIYEGE